MVGKQSVVRGRNEACQTRHVKFTFSSKVEKVSPVCGGFRLQFGLAPTVPPTGGRRRNKGKRGALNLDVQSPSKSSALSNDLAEMARGFSGFVGFLFRNWTRIESF
jgi:hypothetical protein